MLNKKTSYSSLVITFLLATSCQSPVMVETPFGTEQVDVTLDKATTTVPAVYKKITAATSISMEGNYVVIKTKGRPENHKSDYYKDTPWQSSLYEVDTKSGFQKNPNKIIQYTLTFKIPVTPTALATAVRAPQGPIGVTTNGVSIYSPMNADGTEAIAESVSFDSHNGHPDEKDKYHYHLEPLDLTATNKGALVGFMLDGYPVYGPKESDGKTTPTGLDSNNGHTHTNADFPKGIYHYHVGATALLSGKSYFNAGYMKGVAGTVTYTADFKGQDWSNIALTGLNLTSGDFRSGKFVSTNFSNANLTNANFTSANLTKATLTNAVLTNAVLTNAVFSGATWIDGIKKCATPSIGSCK